MYRIALAPRELYLLWLDAAEMERRVQTRALPIGAFARGTASQLWS
jgi:hypothetical protein